MKALDVVQLHDRITRPSFAVVDTLIASHQKFVYCNIDIGWEIAEADSESCQVTFFVNPKRISQVRNLADRGIRLPQKGAYFYPKLLSGLVINQFKP